FDCLHDAGVQIAERYSRDTEFHTHIAKCSRNRVVETLIPLIQTAVYSFGNLTFRSLQKETIETHLGITNAILDGDMIGAKSEMNMHLIYNRQRLIRIKREKEQLTAETNQTQNNMTDNKSDSKKESS
ncbi:MAG: FCD domain-containing protein, partial [Lachnospiraceae bacterium]|nr:FCD domain-containing protein [Lachnospiraceae bacterium]